jgi:Gamma-glutamyl cyclotransferase, AIG2-like
MFYYFAYGSNMLTSRLRARCPSAAFHTTATVRDYTVMFGKLSEDKSGKATLVRTTGTGHSARGAVFKISARELAQLDRAEGAGYTRLQDFPVECTRSGEAIKTHTYVAKKYDGELRPYDWYLALVVAGIMEHEIGDDYRSSLRAIHWEPDPELKRPSRQEALRALGQAGVSDPMRLLSGARI